MGYLQILLLLTMMSVLFVKSAGSNGKMNQWKTLLRERAEAVIALDSSGLQTFSRLGCSEAGTPTHHRREVSFSVYPSKRLKNQGKNVRVKFDSVLVNKGGGYNTKTGTFVCPVSGNYMITVDVLTQHGELWWEIKVNGVPKGYVYCLHSEGRWKPASRTIIVRLKKGDQVYIVNHRGRGDACYGTYTGFSGTLLT